MQYTHNKDITVLVDHIIETYFEVDDGSYGFEENAKDENEGYIRDYKEEDLIEVRQVNETITEEMAKMRELYGDLYGVGTAYSQDTELYFED